MDLLAVRRARAASVCTQPSSTSHCRWRVYCQRDVLFAHRTGKQLWSYVLAMDFINELHVMGSFLNASYAVVATRPRTDGFPLVDLDQMESISVLGSSSTERKSARQSHVLLLLSGADPWPLGRALRRRWRQLLCARSTCSTS